MEEGARLPPPPSGFQPPPQTSSVPPPPPPSFSMKSPQAAAGFSILRDSKYWTLPPSRIPRHIWVSLSPGPLLLLPLPSVPLLPRRPLWSNCAVRGLEEEEEEEGPEFANFVVLGNGAAELPEKGKRFSFIGALKEYADIFVIISRVSQLSSTLLHSKAPMVCCTTPAKSFVVGFPTLWTGTDTNRWSGGTRRREEPIPPSMQYLSTVASPPPLSHLSNAAAAAAAEEEEEEQGKKPIIVSWGGRQGGSSSSLSCAWRFACKGGPLSCRRSGNIA